MWRLQRVVLQKIREKRWKGKSRLLLSLGGHSKQAGEECHLPQDVSFFHAMHLAFPDHVHDLISLQGSPRTLEGKEAHPRLDQPFDEAMILFNQVIQVFEAGVSSTPAGRTPLALRSAIALG